MPRGSSVRKLRAGSLATPSGTAGGTDSRPRVSIDEPEERDMATLTVWKFDSTGGAESALVQLERMQKEELIQINDAAYVYWPEDKKKPKTEQLHKLKSAGALGGSFWGLLFGLIFFVP